MSQSNVAYEDIVLPANETLTSLEARILMIISDSGTPKFALPNAVTDRGFFVCTEGAAAGENASGRAIHPGRNYRMKLSGTCAPDDIIVLATPDGTHDGHVQALPATPGKYTVLGIAEETGVDEQEVLVRGLPQLQVIVPAANIADAAALTENSGAIGGTNDGDLPALVDPAGDSGASVIAGIRENATAINALTTKLNAVIAAAEAAGILATS